MVKRKATPPRRKKDAAASDFACMMRNVVHLSDWLRPSQPTAIGPEEQIWVEVSGDSLTIADVKGRDAAGALLVGGRLHAIKSLDLPGAVVFTLLSEPPPGLRDARFFSAVGSAILFDATPENGRRMRACGADRNAGAWQGWIFDAVEIGG